MDGLQPARIGPRLIAPVMWMQVWLPTSEAPP